MNTFDQAVQHLRAAIRHATARRRSLALLDRAAAQATDTRPVQVTVHLAVDDGRRREVGIAYVTDPGTTGRHQVADALRGIAAAVSPDPDEADDVEDVEDQDHAEESGQ